VPIIDAVLVLAAQPVHLLHARPGVPDRDRLGRDAGLDDLPDQPCRHRVGVLLHLDGAAPADLDPLPLQRLQPPPGQRPQPGHFLRRRRAPLILAGDQREDELPVGRAAGEVPAAPQQQGLPDRFLEPPMRLLAVPVLMGPGGVGRLGRDAVMA
jgi:hypothetical protein